ncbi:hypothetical protein N9413_11335 [Paracoccaceae bacterium]|nr:hypothetical protein [Paracoccaceae bacterium]
MSIKNATQSATCITRGEKIVTFIEEYCKIPESAYAGQSVKLMKFILEAYDNLWGTS